jgi:hypothetical protein
MPTYTHIAPQLEVANSVVSTNSYWLSAFSASTSFARPASSHSHAAPTQQAGSSSYAARPPHRHRPPMPPCQAQQAARPQQAQAWLLQAAGRR